MIVEVTCPLPISVITGFLGSGKTTLLASLLKHRGMDRALVVVNDFGEMGLDHLLIEPQGNEIVAIDGGCLCCSLKGDLVETLKSIAVRWIDKRDFDQVLIETTGLADPTGILQSLLRDPEISRYFSVVGVITVVDSLNGTETLNSQPTNVRQILAADHLIVSKTDISSPDEVLSLSQKLRRLNPTAAQHICIKGEIDPSIILSRVTQPLHAVSAEINSLNDRTDSNLLESKSHDDHVLLGNIRTFTLTFRQPVTQESLVLWMHLISAHLGPKLLRIKGLVNVEGNPIAIHAVRHLFYDPSALPSWPNEHRDTRIVFITEGIARESLEWTFSAFDVEWTPSPALDRIRYEKMSLVFQKFRRAAELDN